MSRYVQICLLISLPGLKNPTVQARKCKVWCTVNTAIPLLLSIYWHTSFLQYTYPHFKVNLCCCTCICMFITISICISICRTCLVLSVVVRVHFICFTVGEWETFLSIPCMSDMQEIDNKATLTLTLTCVEMEQIGCEIMERAVVM